VSTGVATGVVEAVDRVVSRGGGADDVRNGVEQVLRERLRRDAHIVVEPDDRTGVSDATRVGEHGGWTRLPVTFDGARVATLAVALDAEGELRTALERVATLVSPYCRAR
jgi:hypothetical protein